MPTGAGIEKILSIVQDLNVGMLHSNPQCQHTSPAITAIIESGKLTIVTTAIIRRTTGVICLSSFICTPSHKWDFDDKPAHHSYVRKPL